MSSAALLMLQLLNGRLASWLAGWLAYSLDKEASLLHVQQFIDEVILTSL
jgi:hypothetical protein